MLKDAQSAAEGQVARDLETDDYGQRIIQSFRIVRQ